LFYFDAETAWAAYVLRAVTKETWLSLSSRQFFEDTFTFTCTVGLLYYNYIHLYFITGWLKKSKLLTQYNSLLFLSHPV